MLKKRNRKQTLVKLGHLCKLQLELTNIHIRKRVEYKLCVELLIQRLRKFQKHPFLNSKNNSLSLSLSLYIYKNKQSKSPTNPPNAKSPRKSQSQSELEKHPKPPKAKQINKIKKKKNIYIYINKNPKKQRPRISQKQCFRKIRFGLSRARLGGLGRRTSCLSKLWSTSQMTCPIVGTGSRGSCPGSLFMTW